MRRNQTLAQRGNFQDRSCRFPGRPAQILRAQLWMVALLVLIPVLASCLGPHDPDPTGSAPVGHLDGIKSFGTRIRATGWFVDPDTHQPIVATITVEGVSNNVRANLEHSGVTRQFPRHGSNHGFDVLSQPLRPGTYVACVWAKNVGRGMHDRHLGCHDVVVDGRVDPIGSYEYARVVGSERVQLTGWALDFDTYYTTSIAVRVRDVTDSNSTYREVYRGRTNDTRADINNRYWRNAAHGFKVDLTIPAGRQSVCVTAINVGGGVDRDLGCATILVHRYSPIAPGGALSNMRVVGPVANHPLHDIQRDAGINVVLNDQSTLWLFGDSLAFYPDGNLKYFVNNSASWAAAPTESNPHRSLITTDAVDPRGEPFEFVTPDPSAFTCPPNFQPAMWPTAATAVPIVGTNRDRVIAFFGNVCLGGPNQMLGRGMAVVEWEYDPAKNYAGQRLQGRIINPRLFPTGIPYGTAAMFVADESGGHIYAYRCERPADSPEGGIHWPDAFGDCFVIRAKPQDVATLNQWQALVGLDNGGAGVEPEWAPITGLTVEGELDIVGNAAPHALELADWGHPDGDVYRRPVAGFTVIANPTGPGFLMAYSPWPGYTSHVALRHANHPWGPWSVAERRILPGCDDAFGTSGRFCYSATVHGLPGPRNQLRLGWYDQLIKAPPEQGAFLAGLTQGVRLIDE